MATRIDDVQEAYKLAKVLSGKFSVSHTTQVMDQDDYTQEAMIGWLTNRNMYHTMIDAFRKLQPLSYSTYIKNPHNPNYPSFVEVSEWLDSDPGSTDVMDTCENAIFADQVKQFIIEVIGPEFEEMGVALLSYLFYGASKHKIACTLRRSQDRVSKLLNEGIAILKEANDAGVFDTVGNFSCRPIRFPGHFKQNAQ